MIEAPDPFEALLSALRPHEVSSGLRQRVAERLGDSLPPKRWRPWRIALALVGGLAAACLAGVLVQWEGKPAVKTPPIAVLPQPAPPLTDVAPAFTILAYERALARSPEDLDALLTRDGAVAPESNPELVQIRAFSQSNAGLHTSLGDK
jgi:hypothetical protein